MIKSTYVVETESGISGNSVLGTGSTYASAQEDAFGPKPWTAYTKKIAKKSWTREVRATVAEELGK